MTTTKINGYNVAILRAGLLLGLHVKVDGARQYSSRPLDSQVDGDTLRRSWVGECVIPSRTEAEASDAVRSKCRQAITRCCVNTEFGPLCPADKIPALWDAVKQARAAADTWNDSARYARVRIALLPAILGDPGALDAETRARILREADYALAAEMRTLLGDIRGEFGKLEADPKGTIKRVRAIAAQASQLSKAMADKQAGEAREAIKAALDAATAINRRAVKLGENLSEVLGDVGANFKQVDAGRFAALDLEQSLAPESVARMSAVDLARFAGLEIDPSITDGAQFKAAPKDTDKRRAAPVSPIASIDLPSDAAEPAPAPVRAPVRVLDLPPTAPEPPLGERPLDAATLADYGDEPSDDDMEQGDAAPEADPEREPQSAAPAADDLFSL